MIFSNGNLLCNTACSLLPSLLLWPSLELVLIQCCLWRNIQSFQQFTYLRTNMNQYHTLIQILYSHQYSYFSVLNDKLHSCLKSVISLVWPTLGRSADNLAWIIQSPKWLWSLFRLGCVSFHCPLPWPWL